MKLTLIVSVVLCITAFAFASVKRGFGDGKQDWGYVTVRPKAHMFWWLYYTTADVENYTDRPLVIWLQGGPGGSSTGFGNFAEFGPLDLDLNPRNYTWVKDLNVLFIDNPVGTGFSYTEDNSALTTTNRQIADDLVEMMRGFYRELPEFIDVPLYIFSQSYGGKMAAEFALVLEEAIDAGTIESNFIAVDLGAPWVSPIDSVLTWAPFLLHVGAVDVNGYNQIDEAAQLTKFYLDEGRYLESTVQWAQTQRVLWNVAHYVDFYNILIKIRSSTKIRTDYLDLGVPIAKPSARADDDEKLEAIMEQVREALGLNVTWGRQSNDVFSYLSVDFMKPVTDIVERLLNETDMKVVVHTGQLDLICDTPGAEVWVNNLRWEGSSEWLVADRPALVAGGYNEGYLKTVGKFTMYWVNRAGHMVPLDNPPAMDFILRDVTDNFDGTVRRK